MWRGEHCRLSSLVPRPVTVAVLAKRVGPISGVTFRASDPVLCRAVWSWSCPMFLTHVFARRRRRLGEQKQKRKRAKR